MLLGHGPGLGKFLMCCRGTFIVVQGRRVGNHPSRDNVELGLEQDKMVFLQSLPHPLPHYYPFLKEFAQISYQVNYLIKIT